MIVVADTSPITALLGVGQEGLLQKLFGEVIIPEAVRDELAHGHGTIPDWLRVEAGMYLAVDIREQALRSVGE